MKIRTRIKSNLENKPIIFYKIVKIIYKILKNIILLLNFVFYPLNIVLTLIEYYIKYFIAKLFNVKYKNVFLDISFVSSVDFKTGIQRVVSNIAKNTHENYGFLPVKYKKNVSLFFWPNKWINKNLDIPFKKKIILFFTVPVFNSNSKLIFIDSIWNDYQILSKKIFPKLRNKKIKIICVVYDIIPILYPKYCDEKTIQTFPEYIRLISKYSEKILCISETVKYNLKEYLSKYQDNEQMKILSWNLGHDIKFLKEINENDISNNIKNIFKKKTYLMVGTVEPRKGHNVVLDSFELISDLDLNINLCIIGKSGWKNNEIIQRLEKRKNNIYYLGHVDENVLNYAYMHSRCLIQASFAEGYGLPIIEAAKNGVKLLISDLPVFKEVSQDKAVFFKTGSANDLAEKIHEIETEKLKLPNTSDLKVITWKESSIEFIKKAIHE